MIDVNNFPHFSNLIFFVHSQHTRKKNFLTRSNVTWERIKLSIKSTQPLNKSPLVLGNVTSILFVEIKQDNTNNIDFIYYHGKFTIHQVKLIDSKKSNRIDIREEDKENFKKPSREIHNRLTKTTNKTLQKIFPNKIHNQLN